MSSAVFVLNACADYVSFRTAAFFALYDSKPGTLRLTSSAIHFIPSVRLRRFGKLASRISRRSKSSSDSDDAADTVSIASSMTADTVSMSEGRIVILVDEVASVKKETRMMALDGLLVATKDGRVSLADVPSPSLRLTSHLSRSPGAFRALPAATMRSTRSCRCRRRTGSPYSAVERVQLARPSQRFRGLRPPTRASASTPFFRECPRAQAAPPACEIVEVRLAVGARTPCGSRVVCRSSPFVSERNAMLARSSLSCFTHLRTGYTRTMTVPLPSVRLASSSTAAPPPLRPPLSSKERIARNQAKRVQVSRDFRTCVRSHRLLARA